MVCFFFKQKTAYELRISDWISDVCSSDLPEKWVANIELGYFVLDTVAIQFAGTTPATTPNKPAGSLEAVPNLGNDKFSIFTLTGTYHPLRGGPVSPYVGAGVATQHVWSLEDEIGSAPCRERGWQYV